MPLSPDFPPNLPAPVRELALSVRRQLTDTRLILPRTLSPAPALPPAAEDEAFRLSACAETVRIDAKTTRGLFYGLHEVDAQLRLHGRDNLHLGEYRPTVPVRSLCFFPHNRRIEEPWIHDRSFWQHLFGTLSLSRFNTFALVYGHQTPYFSPPFPFLFDLPGYEHLRTPGYTPADKVRNLRTLQMIAELAHENQLSFVLGIWQQRGDHHDVSDVQGLSYDHLFDYAPRAIAHLLDLCPQIDGLQLRMNSESGIDEDDQTRFFGTFIEAALAKRPQIWLDLRAKGLRPSTLTSMQALGQSVTVSTKFWCEHLAQPHFATRINPVDLQQYRRYGYWDLLSKDRPYQLLYRLWTVGTQRLLLWGDVDYAERFAQSVLAADGLGYEVCAPLSNRGYGNMDHGPCPLFRNSAEDHGAYLFDRYWAFFLSFGLAGFPSTSIRRDFFQRLHGDYGPQTERALQLASQVLPLLATAHCPSASVFGYWPELYTGGTCDTYAGIATGDTERFHNVADYLADEWNHHFTAKASPLEIAARFRHLADELRDLIHEIDAGTPLHNLSWRDTRRDLWVLLGLAKYHEQRTRAAIGYHTYRHTGCLPALHQAVEAFRQALKYWQMVVEITQAYSAHLVFNHASRQVCHWQDELPWLEAEGKRLEDLLQLAHESVADPTSLATRVVDHDWLDHPRLWSDDSGVRQYRMGDPRPTEPLSYPLYGLPPLGAARHPAAIVRDIAKRFRQGGIAHAPLRRVTAGKATPIHATLYGATDSLQLYVATGDEPFAERPLEAGLPPRPAGTRFRYYLTAGAWSHRSRQQPHTCYAVTPRGAPQIDHTPVSTVCLGQPLYISCRVHGELPAAAVRLHVRRQHQAEPFDILTMDDLGDQHWSASVATDDWDPNWNLQYAIEAVDIAGRGSFSPDHWQQPAVYTVNTLKRTIMQPGFYPFWFWNARLEDNEIRWQIAQMAEQGIRGFYIHSRQGLDQPYLSEAFFAKVKLSIETAEAHGMTVHLYDEFPYPSGPAGGETIIGNPAFQGTCLTQQVHDVDGGLVRLTLPPGQVISCLAYPLANGSVDWDAPTDLKPFTGMLFQHHTYHEMGLTSYNRKRFLASEPAPVVEVELPPGRYRIYAGIQQQIERNKYWGYYIDTLNPEAIRRWLELTHERYWRHIGEHFGKTVLSIFVDETAPHWSARLPTAWRDRYGEELPPLLPALQDADHPRHHEICDKHDQLRLDLFVECFEIPVRDWCREHHLLYASEKPSLRLSQLKFADLPGGDPGHTKAGAPLDLFRPKLRDNARGQASAAYLYNKPGAIVECYHSIGWSGTLQDAKLIADGLTWAGIPYLVPHGFFYSTHGLRKHDAPPSFFFQMPYWHLFGHLSRRLERLWELLDGTWIDAQVLMIDPIGKQPSEEDIQSYKELLETLFTSHLDFLHVDTDVLAEANVHDGAVVIRDVRASTVILPPVRVEAPALTACLDRLTADGVHVIRWPDRIDVEPRINLGTGTEALYIANRRSTDRHLVLALNPTREAIPVVIPDGYQECPLEQDCVVIRDRIDPFDMIVLERHESSTPVPEPLPLLTLELPASFALSLDSPNLLRLYEWELTIGDQTATVPAIPLANQLKHCGLPIVPAFREGFGVTPELLLPELDLAYTTTVELAVDAPVELVMEPDSIGGDWTIEVNGVALSPEDVAPTATHIRGSLGVDITDLLRQGENCLTVKVKTRRLDGGLLNALYLAGPFGVELTPHRLVPLPTEAGFETYERLPCYAGMLTYSAQIELQEELQAPAADRLAVAVAFPSDFEEAAELSLNGSDWYPLPWSPRRVAVPADTLRQGTNELALRVHTSLIRAFEGQFFDADSHTHIDVDRK